ncbi:hypothetical protein GGTG_12351 [Gaeumannomyces tritici R3-111a-1]|uniref:Uncharacterized protein n=1 Tax=Gaeumannomyces tritici (strain R3-111a-1) TaxID=644352 RepID=J3PFS6_GAET3|nr:hypothetical protein GGTG_12351 [Gaeumannomyces tritici R3-111a-1]EJT70178.1 hypothetical protein GGTG_12351 [Gaeumannomyces tritici R3-111a-1]
MNRLVRQRGPRRYPAGPSPTRPRGSDPLVQTAGGSTASPAGNKMGLKPGERLDAAAPSPTWLTSTRLLTGDTTKMDSFGPGPTAAAEQSKSKAASQTDSQHHRDEETSQPPTLFVDAFASYILTRMTVELSSFGIRRQARRHHGNVPASRTARAAAVFPPYRPSILLLSFYSHE